MQAEQAEKDAADQKANLKACDMFVQSSLTLLSNFANLLQRKAWQALQQHAKKKEQKRNKRLRKHGDIVGQLEVLQHIKEVFHQLCSKGSSTLALLCAYNVYAA